MGNSKRFKPIAAGMKILVASDYSGKVREAFRGRGHNAFSCDWQPSVIPSRFHTNYDVLKLLHPAIGYDMVLAFEPTASEDKYFKAAPRVVVANPDKIEGWRRPDQVIEPYHFGHAWFGPTYLWLKHVQPLRHTKVVQPTARFVSGNHRSVTLQGIADAMAEQWG